MTTDDLVKLATPLAIIAAAIIQQINANRAAKDREQIKVKTEEVKSKVDEVHVLTNSNLQQVTTALKVANEKIIGLEKMLLSMNEAKVPAPAQEVAVKLTVLPQIQTIEPKGKDVH